MSTENSNVAQIKERTLFNEITEYEDAKARLDHAKKVFADIETKLTKSIGHHEEGAFTYKSDTHKIVTTGKITRKVDPVTVWQVKAKLDNEALFTTVISFEPKLNLAVYKRLAETNPATYKAFSTCITSKPAKTSIKVETL